MKRLPRLADWPLIVKFGMAPALALGLLLVMAVSRRRCCAMSETGVLMLIREI